MMNSPQIGTRITGIRFNHGAIADHTGQVINRGPDYFLVEYADGSQLAYADTDEGKLWRGDATPATTERRSA